MHTFLRVFLSHLLDSSHGTCFHMSICGMLEFILLFIYAGQTGYFVYLSLSIQTDSAVLLCTACLGIPCHKFLCIYIMLLFLLVAMRRFLFQSHKFFLPLHIQLLWACIFSRWKKPPIKAITRDYYTVALLSSDRLTTRFILLLVL